MAAKPEINDTDWGTKLNDFLDVSHDADGTLKAAAVTEAATGTGFLKTSTSTVFNAAVTTASTFQDLDLSAVVGSNAALVFFEIKINTGGKHFAMKPKGAGGTWAQHYNSGAYGQGSAYFYAQSIDDMGYLVCMTDANGFVQIGCTTAGATVITLKVLGFVK